MKEDSRLSELIEEARTYIDNAREGLPEELFLFATELTPMVNVDLLIRDEAGRILLAWRKDRFYEEGWHVPGGIVRLKETFEERIKKVALAEIGCENLIFDTHPVEVVPIICEEMPQRGHFITFVYECRLPRGFIVQNKKDEHEAGFLKWHDTCPDNILKVHEFYRKYWSVK